MQVAVLVISTRSDVMCDARCVDKEENSEGCVAVMCIWSFAFTGECAVMQGSPGNGEDRICNVAMLVNAL